MALIEIASVISVVAVAASAAPAVLKVLKEYLHQQQKVKLQIKDPNGDTHVVDAANLSKDDIKEILSVLKDKKNGTD